MESGCEARSFATVGWIPDSYWANASDDEVYSGAMDTQD
jgi:hypothetical protein